MTPIGDSERDLNLLLRRLRAESASSRSSAGSRALLMRKFEAACPPKRPRLSWFWALAPVAAALLLAPALVRHPRQTLPYAAGPESPAWVTSTDGQMDPQDEGFVAVPYVPPLATGELVRVVHTELHPSALASLGVNVDPALNSVIAADLLMGEDGFPRAVRVANEF